MILRYALIKSVCCGQSDLCDEVGRDAYGTKFEVNEAYRTAAIYNGRKCGCRVEVKEVEPNV